MQMFQAGWQWLLIGYAAFGVALIVGFLFWLGYGLVQGILAAGSSVPLGQAIQEALLALWQRLWR